MRKKPLLACLLAAACGRQSEAPANPAAAPPQIAPAPVEVQTATLTGLYETGGPSPSQLCITERRSAAHFGLVVRRNGGPGCAGVGSALRNGGVLRLGMNGDTACTIEARLEGGRLTFPAQLPAGCAYYCRAGASAAGLTFVKTGGTSEAARQARDLVGDRLCP